MATTDKIPKILYRVTMDDLFKVDEEGFLLSHRPASYDQSRGEYMEDESGKYIRSVPMIHPDEWIPIARALFFRVNHAGLPKGNLRRLEINTERVINMQRKDYFGLENGEYYGEIHTSAIIADTRYNWIKDDSPLDKKSERFRKMSPWVGLFISEGYSLVNC